MSDCGHRTDDAPGLLKPCGQCACGQDVREEIEAGDETGSAG